MSNPISGKHAIEVAVFVAIFKQPFSKNTIDALMTLQKSMEERYPIFNTTNVVKMKMEPDSKSIPQSTSSMSGVVLQKIKKDGRPSWTLRADVNSIVITCFDYETWNETSPQAIGDLIKVLSIISSNQNLIEGFALQVVDRFVGASKENYQLKHVFNTKSKYLPRHIRESGALWHNHQGWFNDADNFNGQFLNILNLSTNEAPPSIITTIDHTTRLLFSPVKQTDEITDMKLLEGIFNTLHDSNKETVKDLLNAKQLKAIKLC
jgi:uncharacterized protein (TIGR04255 family)